MINYTRLELDAINYFQAIHNKIWTSEFAIGIISKLSEKLLEYKQNNNLKTYVLPLSGGLDSAIVAGLCQNLNIDTIFIDIESSAIHRQYAEDIATQYKCNHSTITISKQDLLNIMKSMSIRPENLSKLQVGNMKARLRMVIAYNKAQELSGCTLSTDNFSEYNMGFWTLHGDVGDVAPIQFLNKGFELPRIAKELGIPDEIINQLPSDGLGLTEANTDEAQLGSTYKFVDTAMMLHSRSNIGKFVNEAITADIKNYSQLSEEILTSDKYINIISRHRKSEFKRNLSFDNNILGVHR